MEAWPDDLTYGGMHYCLLTGKEFEAEEFEAQGV